MTSLRAWDRSVSEQSPALRDWELYTDGSGHADGYGGWACIGWRTGIRDMFSKIGGQNQTSTARMETEALLQGLQAIAESDGLLRDPRNPRPTVWWLSDRQDLVLSAAGLQERKANPDLWARYDYWVRYLDLHPFYGPRDTTSGNRFCDLHAGVCRRLIKNHLEQGLT